MNAKPSSGQIPLPEGSLDARLLHTEEALEKIAWLLHKKPAPGDAGQSVHQDEESYGDLTQLNRDGAILKAIGRERLETFANDYLELLGTSSAIYEKNGDYAFGIFASGWCRMMDGASRKLCGALDNAEALNSGQWLCHESCWTDCSKRVINECAPVDIACNGGIRMYAVPILVKGNVVGAINFGYGDPPRDPEQLRTLAATYHLDFDNLVREANAYESRPTFIIELAKKRLRATAQLIGSMVETKQSQESLQLSEETLRTTLRSIGDAVISTDMNGRVAAMNHVAESLTGWCVKEAIGQPLEAVFRIINEQSRQTVESPVTNVLKRGLIVGLANHTLLIARDGREIPIDDSGAPIRDDAGKITGVVLVFRDQTKERAAQEALEESERRFHKMLDVVPDMISIHSPEMDILYSNWQGFAAVPETMRKTGTKCYRTYRGHNDICTDCRAKRVLETGQPMREEIQLPDGTWVDLRFIPLLDKDNHVEMFMEWVQDITERKQAVEALQSSESRVRAKLNALLNPEANLEILDLADVIDCEQIQSLMNDFHALTNIGVAIVDLKGRILVGTGWQDICTIFHRNHPDASRNCIESDTLLASGVKPGTFKVYKCKNNMWDMATPIMIGEQHLGNLFLGQFLFADEEPDLDVFREQARCYGFEDEAYLKAYRNIPRWSRQTVDKAMTFYCSLIGMISRQSYAQIKLARISESLRQNEQELKESEGRFKALHNASFGGIAIHDRGLILECNKGLSEISGYSYDELIGMDGLLLISDGERDKVIRNINAGYEKPYEAAGLRKDGTTYPVRLEARNITYKGKAVRVVEFRDITENKQVEKENKELYSQLTQAQKMESVGRLAGGVAHDFNNMLMGMMGYAEECREEIGPEHPAQEWISEITHAVDRAACLTRQLLAFARKQTIAPQVMDLNDAVGNMLKMLRRLIGEDLDLAWMPWKGLWAVKFDPGQVDQILANLCVNARDAIGGMAGKVTIETENVTIDTAYCAEHVEASTGNYVMLAVSDDGIGMDRETLANIFEPFFTTKGLGEGTGLGLATVYGIVKQNNGFVNVYSELAKGTTFRIYLPSVGAMAANTKRETQDVSRPGGTETVMLVEDEKSVRSLLCLFLKKLGYTVLASASPTEALRLAAEQGDGIDLLLTDVVMPGMNGRELAQKLSSEYPAMKVLYMSGYTANVIAHRGILDEGVHFVSKPVSRDELATKVRVALSTG